MINLVQRFVSGSILGANPARRLLNKSHDISFGAGVASVAGVLLNGPNLNTYSTTMTTIAINKLL